jgi:type II secretory pathway pseudopilin PulG
MTKPSIFSREDGFTFAEILVTVAIMAAVLPALLKVFGDTARNVALSDYRVTALYLLETQMSEIEMSGFPDVGQQNDVIGDSIFEWQSLITDVESDEIFGLRKVELTISWEHLGKLQSIGTFTYMADREMQQEQTQ